SKSPNTSTSRAWSEGTYARPQERKRRERSLGGRTRAKARGHVAPIPSVHLIEGPRGAGHGDSEHRKFHNHSHHAGAGRAAASLAAAGSPKGRDRSAPERCARRRERRRGDKRERMPNPLSRRRQARADLSDDRRLAEPRQQTPTRPRAHQALTRPKETLLRGLPFLFLGGATWRRARRPSIARRGERRRGEKRE